MNYADIKENDVANGPGVRVSLFVSGCEHHCKGCFNAETWDFNYGKEFTNDDLCTIIEAMEKSWISGLTILGGEPLHPKNISKVTEIVHKIKEHYPTKTIWLYTGYTMEELEVLRKEDHEYNNIFESLLVGLSVIVDGRFIEEEKNLSLRFRGSRNQRLIDALIYEVYHDIQESVIPD